MTYEKVVTVKKANQVESSDEDNKENETVCISPDKANITKTVSIESPIDLDRTTTKGLGRANPAKHEVRDGLKDPFLLSFK